MVLCLIHCAVESSGQTAVQVSEIEGCDRAGTMAELTNVSLDFAAPEVVRALEAGKTQMKVEPSQDVWALGMVAYELLTRSRAFPSGMAQQVRILTFQLSSSSIRCHC